MTRAIDIFSFGLCFVGWLLLGIFGTWTETAPFWIGAPLLWAAALCGIFTIHQRLRGQLSRSCLVAVLAFTAYVLWRGATSSVAVLARADMVFASTALIGWVLTAVRYEERWQRHTLMGGWALLILGNLGLGLYQLHGDPSVNALSFLGFSRDSQDAVFGGFFPNSNHLCGFLELTAFPVLAVAVFGRVHSFVRMLCALVFVATIYAVAQSTSRGGAVAFGGGAAAFLLLSLVLHWIRRTERSRAVIVWVFALGTVVCLAGGWLVRDRMVSRFGEGKVFNNLNGRSELWDRAAEIWAEAPFVGHGARAYEYCERAKRTLGSKWITWSDTDVDAIFVHNDWLQTLTDYGLAGLLLAALVLGTHGWKALSFLVRDAQSAARTGTFFSDHRGAIVLGALSGMIPFAVHCAVDFQMHVGVNAVLAAAVLGLMANPGQSAAEVPETTAGRSGRKWRMAAVTAAALPAAVMAWMFVPWVISDYGLLKGKGTFSRAVGDTEDFFVSAAMMEGAAKADPLNYQAWQYWGLSDCGAAQFYAADDQNRRRQYLRKAIDRLKVAHRLYPQHPDISMQIARTLDQLAQFDEAEQWFQQALKWGSGSRMVNWYYADHLSATGRYQQAMESYVAVYHKYGGWKRERIGARIRQCEKMLKKQREGAGAGGASPAPAATPATPR